MIYAKALSEIPVYKTPLCKRRAPGQVRRMSSRFEEMDARTPRDGDLSARGTANPATVFWHV